MSVPFSNTHLRVPPGFGTILEGLAREVLRDQPENIPEYAAKYFDALLKQREGNIKCFFVKNEINVINCFQIIIIIVIIIVILSFFGL